MKLIAENNFENTNYEVIVEQANPNAVKKMYLKGPMIVSEVKNQNGRLYKQSLMEQSVDDYNKKYILTNLAAGELNHPQSTTINPDRVVHRIIELNQHGNVWNGKSILLTGAPLADMVAAHLAGGLKYGMSTRGVGEINENGIVDVEYHLKAIDMVADPSGTLDSGDRCWVDGILESKEFMLDSHGEIIEIPYKQIAKDLNTLPLRDRERNEKIKQAFYTFMNSI